MRAHDVQVHVPLAQALLVFGRYVSEALLVVQAHAAQAALLAVGGSELLLHRHGQSPVSQVGSSGRLGART